MRLFNLLFVTALIHICYSCTHEVPNETYMQAMANNGVKIAIPTLSFDSIEQMETQISELCQMNQTQLQNWYLERGFESQYDAMYRVATELRNANSIDEANIIKSRYSSYFLFNEDTNDNEPYNPYIPHNNPLYALVCNINGEVIIDNVVHCYNTLSDAKTTREYNIKHEIYTRAVEQRTNFLYSETEDRKFWAEGVLDNNEVVAIEFTAKKKTALLGWIKYKTQYFVQILRHNNNWESFSPDFIYYMENGAGGLWTVEFKSGTLLPVGKLAYHKTATMSLRIYSRGTDVAGAGILNLEYTSTRDNI
ncbi:MAG: DUF4848 domain-containing protein [Alistipes sp.]|nr:DUF4848 domain-containing protein [Alistipes sp.]